MSNFLLCVTIILLTAGCMRTRAETVFRKELRVPHHKLKEVLEELRSDRIEIITEDFDGVTIVDV